MEMLVTKDQRGGRPRIDNARVRCRSPMDRLRILQDRFNAAIEEVRANSRNHFVSGENPKSLKHNKEELAVQAAYCAVQELVILGMDIQALMMTEHKYPLKLIGGPGGEW